MRELFFEYAFPVLCAVGGAGAGILGTLALRPEPPRPRITEYPEFNHLAREYLHERSAKHAVFGRCAELEARHLRDAVELDAIRRGAVWVPPKPADLGPADLIPATDLPVPVAPVVVPPPRELGIDP